MWFESALQDLLKSQLRFRNQCLSELIIVWTALSAISWALGRFIFVTRSDLQNCFETPFIIAGPSKDTKIAIRFKILILTSDARSLGYHILFLQGAATFVPARIICGSLKNKYLILICRSRSVLFQLFQVKIWFLLPPLIYSVKSKDR